MPGYHLIKCQGYWGFLTLLWMPVQNSFFHQSRAIQGENLLASALICSAGVWYSRPAPHLGKVILTDAISIRNPFASGQCSMQTQANNPKKNVETLLLEECVLFKTKYGNDYQKNAFLQCLLQTADICIERPIASGLDNMQIRAKKETKNVKATIHTGYAFSKKIKKYDHKNRIILPRLFQTYASCTTNPNASDLGNMQRCAAEEFREAETALHAGYASLSQSINNHHKKNCIIPTRMVVQKTTFN